MGRARPAPRGRRRLVLPPQPCRQTCRPAQSSRRRPGADAHIPFSAAAVLVLEMMRAALACATLLCLTAAPEVPRGSDAAPGLIRGRVSIAPLPAVEARPNAGELGMPRGRDVADR